MKKTLNLLMLSTILMSQLTFGLTAFAIERETFESSEVAVEDTSSTEENNIAESVPENNKNEVEINNHLEEMLKKQSVESDEIETIPFIGPLANDVTPRGTSISVDLPTVWLPLGANENIVNRRIKEEAIVSIDDKVVSSSQYTVFSYFAENVDSINSGQNDAGLVTFIDAANASNSTTQNWSFSVNYGSSLVFGAPGNENAGGAYTLHNTSDGSTFINSSNVTGSRGDTVNEAFGNKDYFKIAYFKKINGETLSIDQNSVPDKEVVVKGTDDKQTGLAGWGTESVRTGDVIRTWHAVPEYNRLYVSERNAEQTSKVSYADKDGYAYYEITSSGYKPIGASSLEAEIDEINIPVGTDINSDNLEDFIGLGEMKDNIKIFSSDGDEQNIEDFTIEFVEPLYTSIVGEQTSTLKITEKGNESNWTTVEAPINIIWGNTLASKSKDDDSKFDLSISLLENNGEYYLSANEGEGLSDENYLSIEPEITVYRENDETEIIHLEAEEDETPRELMERWQSELRSIEIEDGDALSYKIIGENGDNTWIAKKEELTRESRGYEEVYYELGEQGLMPIFVNRMTVKDEIPKFEIGTTHEEMNKVAKEQMNLPKGIDESYFTFEYVEVDTATPGVKQTKMYVYEYLVSDYVDNFRMTFDVEYEVVEEEEEDGELNVVLTPQNTFVGTAANTLDPDDYLSKVYFGDEEQANGYFTAKFEEEPNTNQVGPQKTKIRVFEDSNPSNYVIEETVTNVLWGSTIMSKSNIDKTDASISLLHKSNKPTLVANEGTGFSTGNLYSRPLVKVYRTNDVNAPILDVGYRSTGSPAKDTMTKFNDEFSKTELKYGDVLDYTVFNNTPSTLNELGKNTWISRDEKLVKETEGHEHAYYELTKNGYKLMRGNQFTVKSNVPKFDQNTTIAEMNQTAANQLELPAGAESKDFRIEYASVDTKTPGKKTTKMNVYEKLASGGEFMTTYDVSYEVVEEVIVETLEVELKEVSIPVGTKNETLDPNDFIKEVRLGNKKVESSEYTATFEERPNTSLVGTQVTKIKITLKSGTKETVTETTKTNVLWGSSIVTKSTKEDKIDTSVSLLNSNNKPVLVANEGTGFGTDNLSLRPEFKIYRKTDTSDPIVSAKYASVNKPAIDTMNTFNNALYQAELKYGDVLDYTVYAFSNTTTNELGKSTFVSRDEKLVKETEGYEHAYYELTTEGYKLMRGNQFTVKSNVPKFDKNTTIEEMNETAANQLELPTGAESKNFRIEYASVDTKTAGKKTTKMNVYEKLASGGEFMTTYDVSYEVVEEVIVETLEVDIQEVSIPVGTKTESLNPNDYVKEVRLGGKKLSSSEYTASFVSTPATNLVSTNPYNVVNKQKTQIKIETKDKKQTLTKETATMILWGNNIGALRKPGSDSFDSSVSMIDVNGKPTLRANEGNQLSTHSSLNTEPNLSVYRNNDTTKLYEAKTKTKSQKASKLMSTWQSEFDKYSLAYGDVVSYTVPGQKGANTVTARSEKLVTETDGFDSSYYELTKDGYRLMYANQFTVKSTVPQFDKGTSIETMNNQAASQLNLPTGATASDYRIEYASADTATVGKKTTKMNVYEKLATSGEFMTTYDVSYEVVDDIVIEDLEVELQEATIPVGTKQELLDPNVFIKEVRLGSRKLNSSEYTVSFEKTPQTVEVSTKTSGEIKKEETKIKVETKETNQSIVGTTAAIVIWNNTISTKSNSGVYTTTAISLLDNNGKPYLAANEGVKFSTSPLTFNPVVSAFRDNINNPLISDGSNAGASERPRATVEKWNATFDTLNLQYGDVFGYTISEANGTNSFGKRTWASRNEELVLETEGYADAYYEMTKDGYRLMRFNQFVANDTIPSFEVGTSKTDMDKVAKNQLKLPVGAEESNYRFEYASVDTATSGTKITKMNVYEKLATGGEFMTTYDVTYEVNSILTEKYVDDSGKGLKTETQNLTSGQAYQPKPDNYITIDGDLYIYQGWLTSAQTPGKDTPKEGNPPAVSNTTTYQYVYTKADNMINVTIPTEMVFGTYKSGSSSISSGEGIVKNNSKDAKTEVIMGELIKEKSSVTLLKPSDSSPVLLKEKKARLNLTADKKEVIKSLNESDKDKTIKELAPGAETILGMTGKYYGDLNKPQKVQYQMVLKFKVKQ